MAEPSTTPPVETTPPVTPAPLTGSALLESQMDALKPESAPPPETSAPEAGKAPPPAPPKPEKTPPVTKSKPAPAEKALDWKTAPAEFRTAHEKLLKTYEQTKSEKEAETGRLQSRLAELDKRKFLTPEQEAEYAKKEQRLQSLESDLYSRDYRESPEFKVKYETPWKNKYGQALEEVKGLTVTFKENDEDRTRPATKADFDRVLGAPTLTVARRMAKELFGDDADVALQYRAELNQIEENGNKAVSEKSVTFQETRKQMLDRMQNDGKTFEAARNQYDQAIVQKYPEFFGDDGTNAEVTAALKQGGEFVDNAVNGANNMPLEERAKMTSLIRRWAVSWPRDQVIIKQLRADIASKEEELKKYRKSDPGSGGEGGGTPPPEGAPKGSDAMAAEIDKMTKRT
jgi:hypothetical protein